MMYVINASIERNLNCDHISDLTGSTSKILDIRERFGFKSGPIPAFTYTPTNQAHIPISKDVASVGDYVVAVCQRTGVSSANWGAIYGRDYRSKPNNIWHGLACGIPPIVERIFGYVEKCDIADVPPHLVMNGWHIEPEWKAHLVLPKEWNDGWVWVKKVSNGSEIAGECG